MSNPKIVITEFRKPIIFIHTLDELLFHLKEKTKHFTHPVVRLTPEIIEWFNSLQEPFYVPKGKYAKFHTVIWKEVYGKEEWFSSQIIRANLNPYYYYIRGYTEDEAKVLMEEMRKKNSEGVSKAFSSMTPEERKAKFGVFSDEYLKKKYGKEEGYKKWKERNEKWAKTMSQKENVIPYGRNDEYIGFSKISQQLFDKVVQRLAEYFPMGVMGIQYATFKEGKKVQAKHFMENEKRFGTKFVDFYDEISNVVIEFDGAEFHDDPERDLKRLEVIYNASKAFILRIPEDLPRRVGFDKLARVIADYLIKVRNYGFKETENSNRVTV